MAGLPAKEAHPRATAALTSQRTSASRIHFPIYVLLPVTDTKFRGAHFRQTHYDTTAIVQSVGFGAQHLPSTVSCPETRLGVSVAALGLLPSTAPPIRVLP